MGRKKKKPSKPWCWYCNREFDDEKILIQHQKANHFRCSLCHKKFYTGPGLAIHCRQVHNVTIYLVPNALPTRDSIDFEIFGMDGIPEQDLIHHEKQGPYSDRDGESSSNANENRPSMMPIMPGMLPMPNMMPSVPPGIGFCPPMPGHMGHMPMGSSPGLLSSRMPMGSAGNSIVSVADSQPNRLFVAWPFVNGLVACHNLLEDNGNNYLNSSGMPPGFMAPGMAAMPRNPMIPPSTMSHTIHAPPKPLFPAAVAQATTSSHAPVGTDFQPMMSTAASPTFPAFSGNNSPSISEFATNAKEETKEKIAQETKVEKKVDLECKICMDEQVEVVFLPCGHLASCASCAQSISKCPICRKQITGKVRTYLS